MTLRAKVTEIKAAIFITLMCLNLVLCSLFSLFFYVLSDADIKGSHFEGLFFGCFLDAGC